MLFKYHIHLLRSPDVLLSAVGILTFFFASIWIYGCLVELLLPEYVEDTQLYDSVPCFGPRGRLLSESPDDQINSTVLEIGKGCRPLLMSLS